MDHAQYFNTMKNQILSEEFLKMQKLAGIITESQSHYENNEDEVYSESKMSKLKQFIREEVEKELTKAEEKELFDKLLDKYQTKGVEALAKDEKYKKLKENNKKLAADLVGKVRRRAEMES